MIKPRNLKPTFARVLVEKLAKEEEVTASGLILSVGLKAVEANHTQSLEKVTVEDEDNAYEGVVISVGPDVTCVQAKDKVLVGKYAGFEVQIDSRIFMVNDTDIIATVN